MRKNAGDPNKPQIADPSDIDIMIVSTVNDNPDDESPAAEINYDVPAPPEDTEPSGLSMLH